MPEPSLAAIVADLQKAILEANAIFDQANRSEKRLEREVGIARSLGALLGSVRCAIIDLEYCDRVAGAPRP